MDDQAQTILQIVVDGAGQMRQSSVMVVFALAALVVTGGATVAMSDPAVRATAQKVWSHPSSRAFFTRTVRDLGGRGLAAIEEIAAKA